MAITPAESSRRWRENHPERQRDAQRRYRESNRTKLAAAEKTPEQLARRAAAKRRKRATDPAWADRERARARARIQVPRVRIGRQIYFAMRRARLRGAPGLEYATAEKILARLSMFADKCAYCGDPYEHLDHVIPLVRGGSALPVNLVPACKPCNLAKSWKTRREWLADRAKAATA